jgi:protein-tyrosine phosphatase
MIKQQLIDIVSTDTHNLSKRPPNLLEAKQYLKKYYDDASLDLLFNRLTLTTL